MKIHLPTLNQFAFILALNVTNTIFQLATILILVQHADAEKLGAYFIALSFSVLLSIFINFGTAQTALIAFKKADSSLEQKTIAANILGLRSLPFLLSALASVFAPLVSKEYGNYILLTLPMLSAEFLNPQVHLIAHYNTKYYTLLNLLLKSILLGFIFLYKDSPYLIEISLLGAGLSSFLLNTVFLRSTLLQSGVLSQFPSFQKIKSLIAENALIMGNGFTGQLQQSLFLFALPGIASPVFVSAYGFIDKLISSFRMLISAYGTAFLPRAAGLHKEGYEQWRKTKRQQNIILSIGCLVIVLIMFLFPDQLLSLLLFGKNREHDFFEQTSDLIRAISFVPLLISLNLLNVAEIFLEKKYTLHFKGGLFLLIITGLSIITIKNFLPFYWAGFYPLLIEGAALLTSLFIVQQIRHAKH